MTNLEKRGTRLSFEESIFKQKFDKPTLFLVGRQDSCVGYKGLWDIMDNYPRATFAVLDMAGHNLQIEQPDVFDSLFNEWLKRVSYF